MHLSALPVYTVIRKQGEEELSRPLVSLWWAGVAAGLAVSTSVYCKGLLHLHLPDANWAPLISNLGYSVGFLIVILGRLQLFTEQTITAIFPLLASFTRRSFLRTARLWTVVLIANLAGTLLSAALASNIAFANEEQLQAFLEISRHFAQNTPANILAQGIPAGFFLGALVWMLPSAKGSEFWLIVAVTYFIGLGNFSHVVAGSTELFLLMFAGEVAPLAAVTAFIFPALIGNIIGGTVLFSLIAYAQVREEIAPEPGEASEKK